MKTKKELNKVIKNLNDSKSSPLNGHIFVAPFVEEEKEMQVGGIFVPISSENKYGNAAFCKVVVVSFDRESKALLDRCHGKIEFDVGDVCYAVNNTLINRDCTIGDQRIYCIDPYQLVAKIGEVE